MLEMGFAPLVFAAIDTELVAQGAAERCAAWRQALGDKTTKSEQPT